MTVSVPEAAHPAPVAASIIMACRNGEPHLREALEAVAAQVWDRPWELVFVDNGSTDGSLATFDDVAARHPHIPMRAVDASDRAGKSHALNRGIAEARSDILIQCDADDVPAEGWLAAMAEALMRHDFVSARHEIKRLNRGPAAQYRGVSKNGIYRLNFAPYCPWTMGSTMGFTRRLFDAIGGFDPDIHPEDDEFCIRAFIGGFELHPVPRPSCTTGFGRTSRGSSGNFSRTAGSRSRLPRSMRISGRGRSGPGRSSSRIRVGGRDDTWPGGCGAARGTSPRAR
jgi:cellulose synthase/poly-beta-1,6-N-acetylglucosamine synthase-like glycosyltransferase